MDIGTIAQWAGAGATSAAVLVALFKEDLIRLWRSPELRATVQLRAPDCTATPIHLQMGDHIATFECYYFRLWIENLGRERAEAVQVYAAKLLKRHADGVFRAVEDFLPMNLRWAHSNPTTPTIFADINPKMGRHCDLGRIVDPNSPLDKRTGVPAGRTVFHLDMEVEPATGSHLLSPDVYQLQLRIAGRNALPIEKQIEITLPGGWFPDQAKMFADGIGLRELK